MHLFPLSHVFASARNNDKRKPEISNPKFEEKSKIAEFRTLENQGSRSKGMKIKKYVTILELCIFKWIISTFFQDQDWNFWYREQETKLFHVNGTRFQSFLSKKFFYKNVHFLFFQHYIKTIFIILLLTLEQADSCPNSFSPYVKL